MLRPVRTPSENLLPAPGPAGPPSLHTRCSLCWEQPRSPAPAPYPPDLPNPESPSGLSVDAPPPRSLPRSGPGFQATPATAPVLPGTPSSRLRELGLPALLSTASPLPAQGPRCTRPSASLTEHPQSGRLHRGSRRGRLSGDPAPVPFPELGPLPPSTLVRTSSSLVPPQKLVPPA